MKKDRIAIHYTANQHKDNYSSKWIDILKQQGVAVKIFDFREADVIQKILESGCSAAMWHFFHTPSEMQMAHPILSALEIGAKLPVWPNYDTRWHFDNKIAQFELLSCTSYPTIKTKVFFKKNEALKCVREATYPLIIKFKSGAGSANVVKVTSEEEAVKLTERMFATGYFGYSFHEYAARYRPSFLGKLKRCVTYLVRDIPVENGLYSFVESGYLYAQEFLPNNKHDIRISVIGERAFGYIRHNRPGDFRASGSGNFDTSPSNIPLEAVKIARAISKEFSFDAMCYDFLYSKEGGVVLGEISYSFVDWMVEACPGHWYGEENLWIEGQLSPQEAHIESFLQRVVSSD